MYQPFKPTLRVLAIAISLSLTAGLSVSHAANKPAGGSSQMNVTNEFWWPEKLNLDQLRAHDPSSNPYGADFDYAKAFASVDLKALKADIEKV